MVGVLVAVVASVDVKLAHCCQRIAVQDFVELVLQSVPRCLRHVRAVRELRVRMQTLLNGFIVRIVVKLPFGSRSRLDRALILTLLLLEQLALVTVLSHVLHATVLRLVVARHWRLTQVATDGTFLGILSRCARSGEELVGMVRCNARVRPVVNDLLHSVATIILLVVLLDVRVVIDGVDAVSPAEVKQLRHSLVLSWVLDGDLHLGLQRTLLDLRGR